MREIPLEKRLERYDSISQVLRGALNSEEIDHMLWAIGEAHHLGEERALKMVKIAGFIMMGFVHPEDLQREIMSELNIDKRLADEIAHELQVKILNPLMPEINIAFNYHIAGVPTLGSPSAAVSSLSQPEIMRPSFAPPASPDQPFILHEEQKEAESVRPIDETLVRPTFYDPPSHEASEGRREPILRQGFGGQGEETMARLEIGGIGETRQREPLVGKTEEPGIRVVHYSGPQTSVDPFAPQQRADNKERRVEPQQLSKDIHPENIVDLKDLPK